MKPLKPSPPSDPVRHDTVGVLGSVDGVTFQRERLGPILREILPLLRKDWEENGIDHDKVPFNLDLDQYLTYDLCGILQIVTARDAGSIVGYVFALVHPHIDHSGMGWAMLTWYWIYPGYRGGGVGNGLLDAMEGFLREAKVAVVEGTEKMSRPHGLFGRRGYYATDIVFRKQLLEQ